MKPKWISVEDRLPSEEDSDRWGNVLWGNNWDHSPTTLAPWTSPNAGIVYSHWQPFDILPPK